MDEVIVPSFLERRREEVRRQVEKMMSETGVLRTRVEFLVGDDPYVLYVSNEKVGLPR